MQTKWLIAIFSNQQAARIYCELFVLMFDKNTNWRNVMET